MSTYPELPAQETEEKAFFDYEMYAPIGIDLGTTNSAIARWVNRPGMIGSQVYSLKYGSGSMDTLMRSMVFAAEDEDGIDIVVGEGAYRNRMSSPDHVAANFKRDIGDPDFKIYLGEEPYTPVQLSTFVINKLFEECIDKGLRKPQGVVVSVPYYFKQSQNYYTKQAVVESVDSVFKDIPKENRPKVLGLIPEPVAAALSYAFDRNEFSTDDVLLIVDMGGGTLDLTLLRLLISGSELSFEVLSTDGSDGFGGNNFDDLLEAFILDELGIDFDGIEDRYVKIEKRKIRDAVVEAKEYLSFKEMTSMIVTLDRGRSIDYQLRRKTFESILGGNNALDRNFDTEFQHLIDRCLSKASLRAPSVDKIVLIGGSTQIPFFKTRLESTFVNATLPRGGKSEDLYHAVVKGAAIYAAYLLDKQRDNDDVIHLSIAKHIRFLTRTSHSIGIRKYDESVSVLIKGNSPVYDDAPFVSDVGSFWPSAKVNDDLVRLSEITVCQGEEENFVNIGTIKIPDFHAHGRLLEDIHIEICLQASSTHVEAVILIPGGDPGGEDIKIVQAIRLDTQ